MKKVFLCLSACIGFTMMAHAQFREIPKEVTRALKHKYPLAERVSWQHRQLLYQAFFQLFGVAFSAEFSSDGSWRQSAQEIKVNSLPGEIQEAYADSPYKGWQIKKAALVVRADGPMVYRLYIEKSGIHKKHLYFTATGRLEKEALTL